MPKPRNFYKRFYPVKGGRPVYVHRYVMEQHLGRKLLTTEIVHHIDENSLNNDISNLEIMTNKDHVKYHNSKKPPKQKLTDAEVIEIRKKYLQGKTQAELSKEYNTFHTNISHIVMVKSFKSIDEDGLIERLLSINPIERVRNLNLKHKTKCATSFGGPPCQE